MKKSFLLIILCLSTLLLLCSCNDSDSNENSIQPISGTYQTQSFTEPTDATIETEPSINFDLSEYDSHGELSCNRIWVKKTISDWDTAPTRYFAYLDQNGNVIFDWVNVESFYSPGTYGGGEVDNAQPQDYVNNYALVKNIGYGGDGRYMYYILDIDGNEILKDKWISINHSGKVSTYKDHYVNFDEDGYFYFNGEVSDINTQEEERGTFFIHNDKIYRFKTDLPSTIDTLEAIERIDNYFFIHTGYDSYLFDKQGNLVLNFDETFEISPYEIEILDNGNIKAYFEGLDDNTYQCTLNFNGKMIEEPTRY